VVLSKTASQSRSSGRQGNQGALRRSVTQASALLTHQRANACFPSCGLLGGAFRLAPEILKRLDRQGERSHELTMHDKALEFEMLRGAQRMSELSATADAAWNSSPAKS